MPCPFIPKIRPWPGCHNNRRGTMTAASALLSLVFAALALSMLYMSRIHLRISGAKKDIRILEFAAENGVKQGYDAFIRCLRNRPSPQPISQSEMETFYQDCMDSGTAVPAHFLDMTLPLTSQGGWDQMEWASETRFEPETPQDAGEYFLADFNYLVSAAGRFTPNSRSAHKSLQGGLVFYCGRLPLSMLPLAVDKETPPDNPADYLEEKGVSLSHPKNPGTAKPYFSKDPMIPDMPVKALEEALKTEIFHPQDLTSRRLRAILGLEESDDPVPEGVYLIQDDLGLGGVFVQGDVLEMILAITGDFQAIHFKMNAGNWLLKFNPAASETHFITPAEEFIYALVPRGILIINGAVQSLGGGIETGSGDYELIQDEEIPCLLNSVRLTIISTEEVTLTSHLLQEGVEWQDGMPYVKDGKAQLNICAAGCGLGEGEGGDGRIKISEDAPQDMKIQASLTAAGEGFEIEGEDKSITWYGALHTTDISNPDSRLDILADDRFLLHPELLHESPRSRIPLLHAAGLYIKEWNDNE